MSEQQGEGPDAGQVSEVQSFEDADEPIGPGDSVAGAPVDGADLDGAGPDAVPEANREANETTDDEDLADEVYRDEEE